MYGFFGSHLECEWLAEALGLGLVDGGELSFPGFVPNAVMKMGKGELDGLDGWELLWGKQQKRILNWLGRRKKREEPEFEFRYFNADTNERVGFKARIGELKVQGEVG